MRRLWWTEENTPAKNERAGWAGKNVFLNGVLCLLFSWFIPYEWHQSPGTLTCLPYLYSYLGPNDSVADVWCFCWYVAEKWKSQSTWLLSLKYPPRSFVFGPRTQYVTHLSAGHAQSHFLCCKRLLCIFFFCCLIKSFCFFSFWYFSSVNVHQLINWITRLEI